MAAIATTNRIIAIVLMAFIVAILASESAITAAIGSIGSVSLTIVVSIIFLAIREAVKELGLQDGDVNQAQQITDLQNEIDALKASQGQPVVPEEVTPEQGA